MVYLDRRNAQNAADAAAIAGALALLQGQDWNSVALDRAASNGYDNDGTTNSVLVYNPPASGPYEGSSEYVQVVIVSNVKTSLAQLVFGGPLQNTVEAVARGRQVHNIVPGYALYGASPDECRTIWFAGTQATNVNGGGIYSNSTANTGSCPSGEQNGSGDVTVTDGQIELAGSFEMKGGSGSVSPTPIEYVPQQRLPAVPIPDCSDLPNRGSKKINHSMTLQPGTYTDISMSGNNIVQMSPGMYCITGSDGFSASGNGKLIGSGVIIYMQNGSFDMTGGRQVNLTPPTNYVDASGEQWAHMLLYVDPGNPSPVNITGNTGTTYSGTIYAKSSACDLSGTADTIVISSQVICDTVKLSGDAALTVNYDQGDNYMLKPTIDLVQ